MKFLFLRRLLFANNRKTNLFSAIYFCNQDIFSFSLENTLNGQLTERRIFAVITLLGNLLHANKSNGNFFQQQTTYRQLCKFDTKSVLPGLEGYQENLFSMFFFLFYIINPFYKLTEDAQKEKKNKLTPQEPY